MNLTYYISIYGLAEALVLSLALTIFFGIQWWRMRQKQILREQFCAAVLKQFKDEVLQIQAQATLQPGLRDEHIAILKVVVLPFKNCQLNSIAAWEKVISHLKHYFEHLAQPVHKPSLYQMSDAETAMELRQFNTVDANGHPMTEQLDSAIENLLTHYQAATSAIVINQEATLEMKHSYENLQLSNQELRAQIQAERDKEIWEKFDAYEKSNTAFMRALSVKERNYKLLIKEHEALQVSIHNLQIMVSEYRKTAHQLILQQDALIAENKLLREQQESTNRLVTRLNHNYDTLRSEYTKLFEKMQ